MIPRHMLGILNQALKRSPAVVLLGPRQVGKTTLARALVDPLDANALYLDLERPTDVRRLDDADAFLRAQKKRLCVIDEVQYLPTLFPILRGVIDERRREGEKAGQFLLLGSAALELVQRTSETLAGRLAYLELGPLNLSEIAGFGTSNTLWNRGGFPESFLAESDDDSLRWRQDFIRSYLDRDISMFAPRLPKTSIERLWVMLATAHGSLLHVSRLATNLGVSAQSADRYLDLLVDLLLVRSLPPWSSNLGKRLVRTPKTYIRDSGILHALLDIGSLNSVLGHVMVGASWEGFVIENILSVVGNRYRPYFYRTQNGAEVDLLLESGGKIHWAIEIKRSSAPTVSKGFYLACESLQPQNAAVIHGGDESWPMANSMHALSLPEALAKISAGASDAT